MSPSPVDKFRAIARPPQNDILRKFATAASAFGLEKSYTDNLKKMVGLGTIPGASDLSGLSAALRLPTWAQKAQVLQAIPNAYRSAGLGQFHIMALEMAKIKKATTSFHDPAFLKLQSITDNHRRMLDVVSKIPIPRSHFPADQAAQNISRLFTVEKNLIGISSALTEWAIKVRKISPLDDLEEVTTQAAEITAKIAGNQPVTHADLEQLKEFIISREQKKGTWHYLLIVFFQFLLMALDATNNINGVGQMVGVIQDDHATREDLENLKTELLDSLKNYQSHDDSVRCTLSRVHLRLKPDKNSLILLTLGRGETVEVLRSQNKWLQISVIDKKDNVPVVGWVFKKYLENRRPD
ncbi:SH3 domain-containing protein [Chryseolinea soli]|uniref:SH3 domain-containing protein n=1 Tax=Chryseolinea soli TaxID=2321403 RepID=A0A385SSW9_9BACT|nr:SH3 domain-containing protein [Chryseolinea soli]AYB34923.1 SH3 domain-containing protein [Chryseolinea soli]